MNFTFEQPEINVAVPHATPAEAALRDLVDEGYFLVKGSEVSALVGGLKLGIWDEDGTDTLAGTGRFHDITTGTTGDMKELRSPSLKNILHLPNLAMLLPLVSHAVLLHLSPAAQM
jgi:hypothetical protein